MDQMFNLFVLNRMVWLEDIRGATVFELLMCVDQLIKAIDVRWVDLEDSRLYGVEEIG